MTAQNILFNDGWQFCLCDIGPAGTGTMWSYRTTG